MIRCTIRIDTIIIEWLKTDGNNNSYSILYNVKENTRERGREGGRGRNKKKRKLKVAIPANWLNDIPNREA